MADAATPEQQFEEEIIEAAPLNGHSAPVQAPPPQQSQSQPQLQEKIVRTIVRPVSDSQARTYADPLMQSVNRRPSYRETEKSKSDRAWLDEFMVKPEAADCILIPHRILPRMKKDGSPLKQGRLTRPSGEVSSFEIMPYDSLVEEMIRAWGGGRYRIPVCERSGRILDDARSIILEISSETYPPKAEENEDAVTESKTPAIAGPETASDELKRRRAELKEQREMDAIDDAESKLEMSKTQRQIRDLEQRKALSKLKNGGDDEGSAALRALEKRLDDERTARREAELRAETERKEERTRTEMRDKMFMDSLLKVTESINALANKPAPPPPPPDTTIKDLAMALAPIAAAIISRPAPPLPPPPPPPVDHTPMMMEIQKSNMQTLTAIMNRPKDDSGEKVLDAVVKLTNKDNSSRDAMISGLMQAFVSKDRGQVVTPEIMIKLIEMGANLGGGSGAGAAEADMANDPMLGALGPIGRHVLVALKSLSESAPVQEGIGALLKMIVGKRNPTERDLAEAAYRIQMQQSGMLPPPVSQQLLPHVPVQQQTYPPLPQQRPAPAPLPPNPAAQQVAAELEGQASGLPGNEGPDDAAEPTTEQLAEQHLREEVTETCAILVKEIASKPAARTWPEYALEHVNRDFLQALVNNPSDTMRAQMLQRYCDTAVWQSVVTAVKADQTEIMQFTSDMHRLVDSAKEMLLRQARPAPTPQPQPQPVMQAPSQPAPQPQPPVTGPIGTQGNTGAAPVQPTPQA